MAVLLSRRRQSLAQGESQRNTSPDPTQRGLLMRCSRVLQPRPPSQALGCLGSRTIPGHGASLCLTIMGAANMCGATSEGVSGVCLCAYPKNILHLLFLHYGLSEEK